MYHVLYRIYLAKDRKIFTYPFMQQALQQAQKAFAMNEVPIGAVIVDSNDKVIAAAHNMVESNYDVSAHAEILAIREAAKKLTTTKLIGCKIWITCEPCSMCCSAISAAQIAEIYYGTANEKFGAIEHFPFMYAQKSTYHKPKIYANIMAKESKEIIQKFFAIKRDI